MKYISKLIVLAPFIAVFVAPAWAEEVISKKAAESAASEPKMRVVQGLSGSYLSGQFARNSGHVEESIKYLSDAYKKHPENQAIAEQLLSNWVVSGNMVEAKNLAEIVQKEDKTNPVAGLVIAVSLIKKEQFSEASKILDSSFEASSGQLWLPLVSAWLDIGNKNFKKPMTLEEMPVTVGKAAAVVNYHLALINDKGGFPVAATALFKNAAEKPEETPLRVAQSLVAFYEKNQHPKLLDPVIEAFKKRPVVLPPLESSVVTVSDGVAEVLYTMGSVMQLAGVNHDAMVYLQLAHYLRPDFSLTTMTLGELWFSQQNYAKSSALFAKIPPSSQYYLKSRLRMALNSDKLGKTDEALAAMQQLASASPNDPSALIAKGDLLRVHKRFLEASAAYSEAIARIKNPNIQDWPVFYARGACFERLNKWNEAEVDLKKALELAPNQPDVLNYLGYSWLTRKMHLDEAEAMLKQAFVARPNDPQIIDSYGWALYLLGKYEESLPFLERAVELLAADATVNDHLGDVYWKLGRKVEARFQWERAISFSPEPDDLKKIQTKLANGLSDKASEQIKESSASLVTKPATTIP